MSILRYDPTRTTTLRNQYQADMQRRFYTVRRNVTKAVGKLDVLGLSKKQAPNIFNEAIVDNVLPARQAWRFQTDSQKLASFQKYLQEQIDENILTVTGTGDPWTAKYVDSAYRKGVVRSYNEVNKATGGQSLDFARGKRSQFLESAFNQPERLSKLQFLYTRSFEELKGISAVMSQQMQRVLANGIANGSGPYAIASELSRTITGITKQRAKVLARTEIIAAHAEGQLDSFEEMDIENITVLAEWSTAGDDLVCPMCGELEGAVMTIKEARGLIPRHPNCRCAWIPANVGERSATQMKKARGQLKKQTDASLKAELPSRSRLLADGTRVPDLEPVPRSVFQARSRSTWAGSEKKFPGGGRFNLIAPSKTRAAAAKVKAAIRVGARPQTPTPVSIPTTRLNTFKGWSEIHPTNKYKVLVDDGYDAGVRKVAIIEKKTKKEVIEALDKNIKKGLKDIHPVYRVDDDDLISILNDGRIKSQFETGTSKGLLNNIRRSDIENNMFSYSTNLPVSERPIYGYIEGSNIKIHDYRLNQYGRNRIILKDKILDRTTISGGDTLNEINRLMPKPYKQANSEVVAHRYQRLSLTEKQLPTPDYWEAQYHGGVSLNDIEQVVLARSDNRLETLLDLHNIPWKVSR